MGFPKFTVLGIAALALTGLGVAAVGPQAWIGAQEEPLSFTVPMSRVGDHVVYERSWYSTEPVGEMPAYGEVTSRHVFDVAGPATSLDWMGQMSDAVVVHETMTTGYPVGVDMDPGTYRHTQYLDGGNGTVIRWSFQELDTGQAFTTNVSILVPVSPHLPALDVQGQLLSNGLQVPLTPGFIGGLAGYGGYTAGGLHGVSTPLGVVGTPSGSLQFSVDARPWAVVREPRASGEVALQGTIDGQPVLGVKIDQTVPLDVSHGHHGGTTGSGPVAVHSTEVVWFAEASPYPLLIDSTSAEVDDEGNVLSMVNRTEWLTEFRAGHGPVAWGHGHEREVVSPERSAGQRYPADGEGGSLSYPLSEALDDANSGLIPEYALWRVQYPDAVIVAATMSPGTHNSTIGATVEWRLTFAEPTGAGFQLLVERDMERSMTYLEALGRYEVPAFEMEDLPDDPLTLGQVERYWQSFHPGTPVSYVHWGLEELARPASQTCPTGFSSAGSTSDLPPIRAFALVQMGTANWGSCISDADRLRLSAIHVEVTRPAVLGVYEVDYVWDAEPIGAAPSGAAPATVLTPPGGAAAPTVALASLASSSLLLIGLSVYLLPHFKWFGTQAVLLVPGFSKLKKNKLLDHKLREEFHEAIKTNPGISPSELQRRTGAGWGTVVHHLTMMERHDLVTSAVDGRHRRYFPFLPGGESVAKREAVLANENTQRILSIVTAEPGVPTGQIASELGMSTAGAMWHLGRLAEAGFVDRQKEGRRVRYFPGHPPMTPARPYDPREAVEVV